MKITDLLSKDAMIMDLKATTKAGAIDEMVQKLYDAGAIDDIATYKKGILAREAQTSTGLGDGIAMPHAKNAAVKKAMVLFAKSKKGVDYAALDGKPVYLFFMIAAPEGANNTHLQALAALAKLLIDPVFVQKLKAADTPDEVLAIVTETEDAKEAEEKKEEEEEQKQKAAETAASAKAPTAATEAAAAASDEPFIVAVTACPTGIAHTYMAEDALKKKAKEMGVKIKVETNGSEGIKHRLTAEDIKKAAGVIIAADKNVEMDRFNGKPLVNRPVSDGIRKPEELIKIVEDGKAPIFHAAGGDSGESAAEEEETQGSIWSRIYKDLMNGVSHMLPFVVGGGILMALSFLIEQTVGDHSPIFLFLNSIGTGAFAYLVPILAGFIAMSIGERPALMPGMAAGWMAATASIEAVPALGKAGFLGGLIGGFIAGYVVLWLKHLFRNLPKSLNGLKPILIYPVLGLFLTGLLMYFIIVPIFGGINTAMNHFLENLGTGNAVILGGLLGGMMAVDMGGPVNKAAYTFAIGVYTNTNDGRLMAAVMAGGMIPPLAIAIATTVFKNKFTQDERNSGLANYVMGLSFITEGAIPFAAADPLRVILSSIIGSAIGGGLTQLWRVNVPAPHGGIFVALLSNHPLMFILSVLIGSVITAIIYGIWRRPAKSGATAKASGLSLEN